MFVFWYGVFLYVFVCFCYVVFLCLFVCVCFFRLMFLFVCFGVWALFVRVWMVVRFLLASSFACSYFSSPVFFSTFS